MIAMTTPLGRTRHSEQSDWSTPRWLFDALDERIAFDVDACASPHDALCPAWISHEFEAARVVRTGDLRSSAIWCNPPYGRRLTWWVGWAHDAVASGGAYCAACLVPVRTSTAWWHDLTPLATQVVFVRGRLQFGGSRANAPFDSALVVYGHAPVVRSIMALRGQEGVTWLIPAADRAMGGRLL